MIRKLPSGKYRLYSQSKNPKTGKRRNLGMFPTRAAAERYERAVQFFKRVAARARPSNIVTCSFAGCSPRSTS